MKAPNLDMKEAGPHKTGPRSPTGIARTPHDCLTDSIKRLLPFAEDGSGSQFYKPKPASRSFSSCRPCKSRSAIVCVVLVVVLAQVPPLPPGPFSPAAATQRAHQCEPSRNCLKSLGQVRRLLPFTSRSGVISGDV